MNTMINNSMENLEIDYQEIAIDPGFGDCKWMTKDKTGKFSTSIRRSEKSFKFDVENRDIALNRNEYLFNGGTWYVGNGIAEMGALATRDYSFIEKFAPLIAYKAIVDAGLDVTKPVKIKTCLSIMNYDNRQAFAKSMSLINVNNQVIKCKVDVIAQGFASLIDYVAANDDNTAGTFFTVTNIGFNTIDFCAFSDGQVVYSTANPCGVNEMVKALRLNIEHRFKRYFNEQEVKQIFLDKYIVISGQEVDLTNEIQEIKVNYFETFFYSLPDIADYMRKSTKNIFAGGGAYYLQDADLDPSMVFVESPYEFSDVRGVYYYGD